MIGLEVRQKMFEVEDKDVEGIIRGIILTMLSSIIIKERGERRGENWTRQMLVVSSLTPRLLRNEITKKAALRIFMEKTGKKWRTDKRDYPEWVRGVFRNRVSEGMVIEGAVKEIGSLLRGEKECEGEIELLGKGEAFNFDYGEIVERLFEELERIKEDISLMMETARREAFAKVGSTYVTQDLKKARLLLEYCGAYLEVERELIHLLKTAHDIGIESTEAGEKRKEWLERMKRELEKIEEGEATQK